MKRRLLSILLAVVLIINFGFTPAFAETPTSIEVSANKTDVKKDDDFIVTVSMDSVSELMAVTMFLEFNAEQFECISVTTGNIPSELLPEAEIHSGEIILATLGSDPVDFPGGEVLSAEFKVKEGASVGKEDIAISFVEIAKGEDFEEVQVNTKAAFINIVNYLSSIDISLPEEIDGIPAPEIGAEPVEGGEFDFVCGTGVASAKYAVYDENGEAVDTAFADGTYVEKVTVVLEDGYSIDKNTTLPDCIDTFELDESEYAKGNYVYTRTTVLNPVLVESINIDVSVAVPSAFETIEGATISSDAPAYDTDYTIKEDGRLITFTTGETYKPGFTYTQTVFVFLKPGFEFKEGFSVEDVTVNGFDGCRVEVSADFSRVQLTRDVTVDKVAIGGAELEGVPAEGPTLGEEYDIPEITTDNPNVTIEYIISVYGNNHDGDPYEGGMVVGDAIYLEEIFIYANDGYKFDPNVAITGAEGFTVVQQTDYAVALKRETVVNKEEVGEIILENFKAPKTGETVVYPVYSDDRFITTIGIYDANGNKINPGETYLGDTTYTVKVAFELTESNKDICKFVDTSSYIKGFDIYLINDDAAEFHYVATTAPAELTGITVTGMPNKTAYVYGESFDPTGITVTANYNDGTAKEVSDYTVETKLVPTVTEVTVNYNGYTAVVGGISVAKKELAITGIVAVDRICNGTTEVAIAGGVLEGVLAGDDVYVTMPTKGTVATADAGEKIVAVTVPELMGAQADCYTLADMPEIKVNITAKPLAKSMVKDLENVTYNGEEQTPAVTVKDGDVVLTEDKDYTVEYKDNISANTAKVIVTGAGNYSGSIEKTFKIEKATLTMTAVAASKIYDGKTNTVIDAVELKGVISGDDVSVIGTEETSVPGEFASPYVGTGIAVTAKENFALTGADAGNYALVQPTGLTGGIAEAEQTLAASSGEHKAAKNTTSNISGWAISNAGADAEIVYTLGGSYADVSIDGTTLKVGKNAQLGSITIKAASGAVDVNGDGVNEYGAAETSFAAEIVNKNNAELSVEDVVKTYGGGGFVHTAYVSDEAKADSNGKWNWSIVSGDAIVFEGAYNGSSTVFGIVKAGTAAVTVSYESDNYIGEKTIYITINAKEIASNDFDEITSSYEYTGSEIRPEVVCKTGLEEGVDYTVEYINNTEAGKASVIINGINNYKGTVNRTFVITAKAADENAVDVNVPTEGYVYDGTAKEPAVSVAGLAEGVDYTVTYANNVNAGTAKVTVTFKGNYSGEVEKTFKIEKASVTAYFTAEDKVYDKTTAAEVSFSKLEGVIEADKNGVTYVGTASGNFASPYAGNHSVNFTGNTVLEGAKAENYKIDAVKVENANIYAASQSVIVPAEQQSISQNTSKDVKTLATFVEGAGPIFLTEALPEGVTLENGVLSVGANAALGEVITVKVRSTAIDLNLDGEAEYDKAEDKFISFVIVAKADAEVSVTHSGIVKTFGDKEFGVEFNVKNTAGEGKIKWVSSNSKVIAIDNADTINPTFKVGEAGTATVTVNYEDAVYIGSASVNITVNPKDITGFAIGEIEDAVYSGNAITPDVEVKDNTTVLVKGTDYAVTYKDNVNAGTATVTINGMGNYSGTIEKTFEITAKSTAGLTVSGINASYEYADGEAIKSAVVVTDGSAVLKENTDYTVEYSDNVNPGTAKVTIKGKGNYSGTIEKTFEITAKNIVPTVEISGTYTYTGKAVHPAVTVKYGDKELSGGIDYAGTDKDYSIHYENNVNAGTANLIVTAKGAKYTWTDVIKEFVINPADYTVSVSDSYSLRVGKGISAIKLPKEGNGVNGESVYGTFTAYLGSDVLTDEVSEKLAVGEYTVTWKFVPEANGNYVADEKTGSFTLKVIEKDSQTIEAPDVLEFVYGGADKVIDAKVTVGNGAISYASSNNDVATVDANGKVSVHSAGTAIITVTAAETEEYAEETKDILVTVARKNVTKPTANSNVFTYNGKDQTYAVVANDAYTVTGNTAKDAGSYVVTVSLKDKANTQWADGTTADITFDFVINEAKVEKPVADTTVFTYNGKDRTYAVAANDAYTVTGNTAKDAGSYVVTVALKDKANTQWADGTTADITFDFVINKAKVEKPSLEGLEFIYNGEEHRAVDPADGYIVSGNGGKDAGDYNITVTLDKNYEWADGSDDVLTGSYTVEKATVTITAKSYVVTEGDKAPVLDESSYTVTGLAEGDSLAEKPVIEYAQTPNMDKNGKVEIVVSGAKVPNENNYNAEIVYVSGVLTIEEKKDYDDSDNIIIDLTKPSAGKNDDESNPETGAPAMLSGFAVLAAAAAFIGKRK